MAERFPIPDELARTNREQRGPRGVEWLAELPAILAYCERRWSIVIGAPFPQLSFNYAAPAIRDDGSSVVVKVCFLDKEYATEVDALRVYAGRGAVRLLDFDMDRGVMLLEHIRPGTLLVAVEDDEEATSIAAAVMKRLWRPAPDAHTFPAVGQWAEGLVRLRETFDGGTGPFPRRLVEEAERLFAELLGSMGEQVVLHGDLHHFNILAAEREPWLAIDPKGVVGEAAYETGALIRNPIPEIVSRPDLKHVLARRIDQLAEELGFDRERIRGWAVAQAVLSEWWRFEDSNGTPSAQLMGFMEFCEVLASVR